MSHNVNCIHFIDNSRCMHQAAPRKMFGPNLCLIWIDMVSIHKDPRKPTGCKLCTPHPRPVLKQPSLLVTS